MPKATQIQWDEVQKVAQSMNRTSSNSETWNVPSSIDQIFFWEYPIINRVSKVKWDNALSYLQKFNGMRFTKG